MCLRACYATLGWGAPQNRSNQDEPIGLIKDLNGIWLIPLILDEVLDLSNLYE